jgi:ABC-type transport system involved in multi-copper enzyme maturation permease subunit
MTWAAWRLQRTETLIALGILALLAALLVPTGISMASAYHQDGLGACLSMNPSPSCANAIGAFQTRFQSIWNTANFFTLVPGLIGVALAAPFILDLEHGTYRLAWTQSITRGRWLAGKIGLPTLTALVASGLLILLFTWWRTPEANLMGRLDSGIFDTTGTVTIGYALFALGLALALGALWRRSAASLTLAFIGYFAVRISVELWLRNHLVAPAHATWKGAQQPSVLYNAHVLSLSGMIHGRPTFQSRGSGFLGGHVSFQAAGGSANNATFHATYIPASDFWSLQLTETALFVGLAILLIGFAVLWTRERVA